MSVLVSRKAHPDEKGTERILLLPLLDLCYVRRKAHPDEKGTERTNTHCIHTPSIHVAKHIPMRRELKASNEMAIIAFLFSRKAHPDEKGTERL